MSTESTPLVSDLLALNPRAVPRTVIRSGLLHGFPNVIETCARSLPHRPVHGSRPPEADTASAWSEAAAVVRVRGQRKRESGVWVHRSHSLWGGG